MISFRVNAVPVAQPRQRVTAMKMANGTIRGRTYLPARHPVNAFKAAVQQAVAAVHMTAPLAGPIRLSVVFLMPRPKRLIWKSKPMPREYHASKPDADNLLKSLNDSLNLVVWIDDSQIAELSVSKYYASGNENPHVEITITPIETESDRPTNISPVSQNKKCLGNS